MISSINRQLIKAAQYNQLDELKYLLSQGANIHARDDAALRWASVYGHIEIVKFLFTQGANSHANNDEAFKTAIKNGDEPLLMLLNTVLNKEKLVVAAGASTSASSCLCATETSAGSTSIAPSAATGATETSAGSTATEATGRIKKSIRSKI